MFQSANASSLAVLTLGFVMTTVGACTDEALQATGGMGATSAVNNTSSDASGQTSSNAVGNSSSGSLSTGATPIDPGYPPFPDVIDTLTLTLRTGPGEFDGTNANALSLCLTANDCFRLNLLDINDFRRGEIDVYHFEGIGLPRSMVDRVEIRSVDGTDAWRPGCAQITFDGEPVYCENMFGDALFGSNVGEISSWQDPLGLHERCESCYPELLTHGPLVGATTPSSARVLLRSDATRRVVVNLTGPNGTEVAAYSYPSPKDDFTSEVLLEGLTTDTEYQVSLEVEGTMPMSSASFRTPTAASAPLRVAFGSCSREFPQPIFSMVEAAAPDLFLFVGDNNYANSADRDSLRHHYRLHLADTARGRLLARTPTLAIWDDHDFVGNNTIGTSPGKDVALRVFKEYWANPAVGTAATPGVFFNHRVGDVEFFMLDGRYHRSAESNAAGTMVGAEQLAWLKSALQGSTAKFKVLASGSVFAAHGGETWADFPAHRQELFDFIRDTPITGVVLLSGDIHKSRLTMIDRTLQGGYDLPEVTASPLSNPGGACPAPQTEVEVIGCYTGGNYFGLLDFDTAAADPTLDAAIVNQAGTEQGRMTVRLSELQ